MRRLCLTLVAVSALVALSAAGQIASAAPTPQTQRSNGSLAAVVDISPTDVWAAGGLETDYVTQAVVRQDVDGAWTSTMLPVPSGTSYSFIQGLAGTDDDLWAVGDYVGPDEQTHPLIDHWDGSAWSQSTVPAPPSLPAWFNAVSVDSPTDAWAVGQYEVQDGAYEYPIVDHWDGSAWTEVTVQPPADWSDLGAVVAVSPTDVWAGGWILQAGTQNQQSLIEHWDGSTWSQVASPNPQDFDEIQGAYAAGPDDIWMAGYANSRDGKYWTMVDHWNGRRWTRQRTPSPTHNNTMFYGISGTSADDVWAAGCFGQTSGESRPLVEHWDGTAWSISRVHRPKGTYLNCLQAISAAGPTEAVATGYVTDSALLPSPLAERWDGTSWHRQAVP